MIGFGPPVWSLAIVNDGLWVTGVVCRVRCWTRHLRGGNTCCVYQIYASIYICLCGCVADGIGPRFGNVQLAVAADAFGGAISMPAHRQALHLDVDACLGFGCPYWLLRWYN